MAALTRVVEVREAVEGCMLDPLPLSVEPEGDVAVRGSLNSSGLLLLGECHGVAENALIIRALLERFDFGAIALEWDIGLEAALEASSPTASSATFSIARCSGVAMAASASSTWRCFGGSSSEAISA